MDALLRAVVAVDTSDYIALLISSVGNLMCLRLSSGLNTIQTAPLSLR